MFTFEFCTATSLGDVRKLLQASELPFSDIDEHTLKNFLLAITDNGELAGVVGLEKYRRHGLLRSLAVQSQARNSGLGKELVRRAELNAREAGIDSLYSLTTTAAEFFKQLNYLPTDRDKVPIVIARTSEFSHLCPDSAVCLRKSLA